MKKHNTIMTMLMAVAFTILTACNKEPYNTTIETDVQQFEAVWNELNDTYVFWSVDTIDWDAVYTKYHPLFEEMDNQSDDVWKATWTELTSNLLDHHLTISLNRPSSDITLVGLYDLSLQPGYDEVKGRDYYHARLSMFDHKKMLNSMEGNGRLIDATSSSCIYSGVLDEKIAYIYISSFFGLSLDTIEAFSHFKQIVANENIKAAIIDVRDNLGGASENLVPMLSCFTTEYVLIGYTQTKLGLGKYDLSPKAPSIVSPVSGQRREIPIVVLTSVNSASMGEVMPIALRHLPQCYVVGERTFGATGPINGDKKGNGYVITTSDLIFEDVDGTIYEGYGVEPDIECLFDKNLWNSGIDNQLEMAISVALGKIVENGN